jgi:hypothetical protein
MDVNKTAVPAHPQEQPFRLPWITFGLLEFMRPNPGGSRVQGAGRTTRNRLSLLEPNLSVPTYSKNAGAPGSFPEAQMPPDPHLAWKIHSRVPPPAGQRKRSERLAVSQVTPLGSDLGRSN